MIPGRCRRALPRGLAAAALLAVVALAACGGGDVITPGPTTVPPSFKIPVPPPLPNGRLPATVQPERYAVALRIDPAADRFSGEVLIEVAVERPTSVVVLHGAEQRFTKAEVLAGKRAIRATPSFRQAAGATEQAEELVLVAADPIPVGRARIHLVYDAPLSDELHGLYRVRRGDEHFAFTQLEPASARRVLPCFDDPAFKVPFDLRVTVPKGNEVLANTPAVSSRPSADGGSITVTFATTPPMPSYLLGLAIGPLEVREGPREPVPIRLVATRGKTAMGGFALEAAAALLGVLGDYLGRPYPYRKLDLVAVPELAPGAMENAGLITFREELLLLDPERTSTESRRRVAAVMAHELAHQWFGNLVTMPWWDELWLNEGLASYIETIAVDRYKPEMQAGLKLLSRTGKVMQRDALASARAVRQPVRSSAEAPEAFDAITYLKGAAVVGMLQSWLGEEAFRQGLGAYLEAHAWGHATAEDLFAALGGASGKDVAAVATPFVDRKGLPLVRAELSCKPGERPRVLLSQSRYPGRPEAAAEEPAELWTIPVCIEYGQLWQRSSERSCALLGDRSASLDLPVVTCPGWINPNAGHRGYYRYALPAAGRAALWRAAQAQTDARAVVGVLSNAWALVQSGQMPATELLDMLAAVQRARQPELAAEVIAILHGVSDALIEDGARDRYRAFVASLLLPTAQWLGWDRRAADTAQDRLLRPSVLGALGILTDHPWVTSEADRRARAFLADPESIDGDTATIALRVAARQAAPSASLDELEAALAKVQTPEQRVAVLRAIGSLGDRSARERAFGLINRASLPSPDAQYIVGAAADWPDARAHFLDWLGKSFGEVLARHRDWGTSHMLSVARRICDAASRDAAAQTFKPALAELGRGSRRLDEILESADRCIDLRGRQAAQVSAYLERGRW